MLRDGEPPVLCMRKSLSFVNRVSQIDGTVLEPGLIEHGLESSLSSLGFSLLSTAVLIES